MKKVSYLFPVLVFIFLFAACKKDKTIEPIINPEPTELYLVDKIYDYKDNLVAEYIYNDQNKLIKRITTDVINDRSSDYEFEYEGDKLKHIRYIDYTFPQFNHNFILYYNASGQISRDEIYQYGNLISVNEYSYNQAGLLKARLDNKGEEEYMFNYDANGNVILSMIRGLAPDSSIILPIDDPDTAYYSRHFIYDKNPKPNFGLDNQFQMEVLPYFGTLANIEASNSKNNMLEFTGGGTKWIYTYNENNLPATIQTIWEGIETEPMVLKLTYKKIESK